MESWIQTEKLLDHEDSDTWMSSVITMSLFTYLAPFGFCVYLAFSVLPASHF